jgi:hypothetical protein
MSEMPQCCLQFVADCVLPLGHAGMCQSYSEKKAADEITRLTREVASLRELLREMRLQEIDAWDCYKWADRIDLALAPAAQESSK